MSRQKPYLLRKGSPLERIVGHQEKRVLTAVGIGYGVGGSLQLIVILIAGWVLHFNPTLVVGLTVGILAILLPIVICCLITPSFLLSDKHQIDLDKIDPDNTMLTIESWRLLGVEFPLKTATDYLRHWKRRMAGEESEADQEDETEPFTTARRPGPQQKRSRMEAFKEALGS